MYTLPMELGLFTSLPKDAEVDMSKLNFPVDADQQKRAAFIFIRNTELIAKFNFENCSFEDKAEYLLLFMKISVRVRINELIQTWIKIIGWGYVDVPLYSILSDEEIDRFCKENECFVFEIRRFCISIPLISMNYYIRKSNNNLDEGFVDDIPKSNYNEIGITNFFQMTDYEIFKEMINIIDGIDPVFYTEYFSHTKPYYHEFIKLFPYLSLLNILGDGDMEMIDQFIDNFKQMTELPEEKENIEGA